MVAGDGVLSPARHGLLDRQDLVAELDRAAAKKVAVVSAPAGSGKTSLLRLWVDRHGRERRIAFVSVRPGERDAQRFWLTLVGAIRGTPPPAATPDFDGAMVAVAVLAEIEAAGAPFFLVIDDLHELNSVEATESLGWLLTNLPAGAHAIVASRRDPRHLHKLRLAGELGEIRDARLRFTEQETRDLVAAERLALPDDSTALLHQRTEGWAAGLRLAVLALTGHPSPERFVAEFSGSDRTVGEYLTAEMLDRQPSEVQRLLLRTSVLDRVNGELAQLLTGVSGAERMLLDLEDENAFVVSLDADRTWFRYHHLFAGLLRLMLRRTQAEDIPALHRLAARWFADHGQPADAVRHWQGAGDWDEAARSLSEQALSMTLDGQGETVGELLRSFPAATAEAPELALVHAIADLNHMRLDEAAAHVALAQSCAAELPPEYRHRLQTAIASVQLLSARLRGQFDVPVIVPPLPLTGQSTAEIALGSDLRAVALLNLGVAEAWSLRLADSERHLLEAVALARDIGRPYLEVASLAQLGFAALAHSPAVAGRRCEEAVAVAARHGWDGEPVIAPALLTLAATLIWTGEFDRGEQWLDRARHATRAGGEPGIRLLVGLTAAMLPAARGDHVAALEEFAAAARVQERMAGEHGVFLRVLGWTMATQARAGLVDEARELLSTLDDRQAAAGEIRNAVATILLAEKDPAGARSELRPVLDGVAPVNPYLTLVEAHLLDALAGRDLGDENSARTALERALDLAERDRIILPFAMTGAWELLKTLPPRGTSHASLITDIIDAAEHCAPGPRPGKELSAGELRVLRYLPTNLTRQEIATELSVSLNTVNTHLRRIYAKLGATDRSSAVQRGRDLRLLSAGR